MSSDAPTNDAPGRPVASTGSVPPQTASSDAPSSEGSTGAGPVEPADEQYLDQVRREIDEEVRRRRAAGDFPPSFERKLDELFARYTPTGEADDAFTEALKLADRASFFDIDVPVGSRRQARGFVKWSLWQAEAWFVRYVVDQLNHFSASTMRVVHLLDERLTDVERDLALVSGPEGADEDELSPAADPGPFADRLVDLLRGASSTTAPAGAPLRRVLHAECGDGSLLRALAEAGVEAYGIDPGTAAADLAVQSSLDVRRDDVVGHLAALGDASLGGLVLSGVVDRATVAHRRRLLRLAELKLAPGAVLAVVGTDPAAWSRLAGPVTADLAPSPPWHAETWAHLAGRAGLREPTVHVGEEAFAVVATKRPVS